MKLSSLSKNLLFFVISISVFGFSAKSNAEVFYFDYVLPLRIEKKVKMMKEFPADGECSYAFGSIRGDNFLIIKSAVRGGYSIIDSPVFNVSVPLVYPYPDEWKVGEYRYASLGREAILVGKKSVLAEKILTIGGEEGNASVEVWVSDHYGLVAYRPLSSPGRFVLSSLPSSSILDCGKDR